jgi:hypothetical protein
MDLREQLAALFPGNAPHEDAIGATAVEIPIYHRVSLSQPHYALSGSTVFRKDIVFQIVPDLGDPCIGTFLSNWKWRSKVSWVLRSAHYPWQTLEMEHRRDR